MAPKATKTTDKSEGENNPSEENKVADNPVATDPTPVATSNDGFETREDMEARIRAQVLEEIAAEERIKDEERIREKLRAELRQQKAEEDAERAENEKLNLAMALDDPENDFFNGKGAMVVEAKNVHDGEGNKFQGITRTPQGREAFAPPVHFTSASFVKLCIEEGIARPATEHDIKKRLDLLKEQESEEAKGKK